MKVVCDHAEQCEKTCVGKHFEPHEKGIMCEEDYCSTVEESVDCVPVKSIHPEQGE